MTCNDNKRVTTIVPLPSVQVPVSRNSRCPLAGLSAVVCTHTPVDPEWSCSVQPAAESVRVEHPECQVISIISVSGVSLGIKDVSTQCLLIVTIVFYVPCHHPTSSASTADRI